MKRILCIIALLGIAATAAHSQTATAAFSELSVKDKLTIPRYADTPSYGNRGQLIIKYTTDQVYARNGAGTAWILLNGGGGGAAYSFVNALTNDGSGNISLGGEMTGNISIPGNGTYYTFGLGTNSNRLGYINQYAAGSIILNTTNAGLNGYIGVYAGSAKLGSFRAGVGVETLVDTFGLKVTRNGSTVAQIRDMALTTVAYPSVVYDTVSKQFLRSYIAGGGGGSSYFAGNGLTLSSFTFKADTSILTTQARTTAGLALKQDALTFSSAKNIQFYNNANTITAQLPDSTKLTNSSFSNGKADYTTVNPDAFTYTQQAGYIRVAGSAANMSNYIKYTGLQTSSNTWSQTLGFKIQATTGGLGIGVATPSQANALAVRATFTEGVASINVLVPATLTGLVASTKTFNVSAGDSLCLFIKRVDRYVFASLYKPSTGEFITAQKYFDLTTEALIHRVATPAIYFVSGTTDIGTYVFSDANSPVNFALFGDSRSEGAYAGSGAAATSYGNISRYYAILKSQFGNGYNYSLGGNQTTEVLATIDQARLFRPEIGYVNIGTNDALSGNTSAYYNTQINAICYKLIANGIIPVLITANPWDASAPAANSLLRQYKDSILAHVDLKTINTYTTMAVDTVLNPIYNSGDGHENAYGNSVMGNLITAAMRGYVTSGINGSTTMNGGGVMIDMVDNGYGYNEIASNKLLSIRTTTALRAFTADGLQIFNTATNDYRTLEPALKRERFTTNNWKIVHSNLASTYERDILAYDSFGNIKFSQYVTGAVTTLDSTSNYQVMVVNPATGDVYRSKAILGIGGSGGSGWGLTGNSGTTAGTNFIGTTDNVDLVFKWNNQLAGGLAQTNTSFGVGSGAITGGANSSFIGQNAGANNAGSANTGMGNSSLGGVTSGNANAGLGFSSLSGTTTGSQNLGIGAYAGNHNVSGSNQIFINSIFRSGDNSLADDSIHNIVYAFQSTNLNNQKWRNNGKFQVVDGTQGAGKVFTSDANGVGSWQTPSGGSGTEVYNEPSTGFTGTSMSTTNTPTTGTLRLFKNGIRLVLGYDYTITGSTVTLAVAALSGDYFIKDYKY